MSEAHIKSIKEHLCLQLSSGLSRMAYCRVNGISYHQFNYYYRRQDRVKSAEGFVQINTSGAKPSSGLIELHLGNGSFFRFDSGVSDIFLKRIIRLC